MITKILNSVVLVVCLAALEATAKIGDTYPPLSTATVSQMSPPSTPTPAMQEGPIKLTERTQLKHFLPSDYWPSPDETLLTTFEHGRGEKKILAILVENSIRTATGILPPSKNDLKDIPEKMREFFGGDMEKFNTFIANIEPLHFVQEFIQDLKDRKVLNTTLNTSKQYMKHSHTTSKKYDALHLTMSWDKPSAGVHFFGDEYLSNLRVVTRSNEIFHIPGVADPSEGKLNGARVLFLSLSYKDLKLLSHRIDLARKQLSLDPKQAGSSKKVAENIADSVKTCITGINQDLKPQCPDTGGGDSVDPSRVLSTISKQFTKPKIKFSPSGTASLLYSSSNPKPQGKAKRATDMEEAKLPGHFFLAKSFVNGAFENDTMTLGIIGSNMGLNLIETHADEIFWNQVESIAQATRILGKIAGPFGSTSDIELGIWSLSNAVGRLRGDTSRSDRNDAINHILQESIDIAAILTSTSLATAFPFSAFTATEIISNSQSTSALFELTSERIAQLRQREQEIPRLDFNETQRLDSRYVSSANYGRLLHNPLAPAFPNVVANVEHSFEALRKHEELAGIVFPSRSVSYTGPCRLSFTLKLRPQSPPTEVASGCVKDGDCTNWNRIEEIVDPTPAHRDYVRWNSIVSSCQSNNFTQPACYWNYTGYVTYRSCKERTVNELRGLSHYICKCNDTELPILSAAPQKDNKVDFTKKITVYPDRTATEDTGDRAFFKCKPGSKYNQGSRVSKNNPVTAYECEGATAIIQPPNESSVNQTMLFDLKDGDDTVFLPVNSTQRNFFRIGDGRKRFSSGAASDIFELAGPCSDLSGKLDGGDGQDSLVLTASCSAGHPVTIDFINGKVIAATSAVHITSIENLKGRKGQKEHIIVSSKTSHVESGGGSDREPDVISIPDGETATTDITIIASGNTEIISTTGEGQILILIDDTVGNNISTNVIVETDGIPSTGQISVLTVFRNLPFEQVKVQLMNPLTQSPGANSVQSIVITSEVSGSTYRYNLMMPENHFIGIPPILSFTFQNNASDQSSYLSLTAAAFQDTVLYHNLTMRVNPTRLSRQIKEGSKTAKNVFEIFSGSWELIGGSENDEFIIHLNEDNLVDWIIDGQGGNNFLRFNGTSGKASHSELDMVTGFGFKGRLLAKNIHSVTLPQGLGFDLHCACETRRVNALGGSSTTRQRITVKSFPEFCRNRSLEVLATGSVSVFIEETITEPSHVFTTVVSSDINDQLLNFHAYVPSSSGVAFSFLVNDYDWSQNDIQSGNIDGTSIFNLKLLNSKGDKINLQIRELPGIPEHLDQLYTLPSMYFRDPDFQSLGQIFIEKNSGNAKVVHIVDHAAKNSTATRRQGFLELKNVFHVLNGSNWRIIGGNRNDLFRIQTNQLNGLVIDGGNGENTITFEDVGSSENFTLRIDLAMGTALFGSQVVSTIHNVHHVLGRPNSPDAINVTCTTKSVNGRGGHPNDSHDIINITMETSCLHDLIVHVPQYTIVNNIATRGRFTYLVTNFTNSSTNFLSTDDSSQTLIFSQPLWEVIDAIDIDLDTAELLLRLNTSDSLQYPLGDLRKGKFHNPVFKILPDGSSVACQLELTEEGNVHAAFHISKLLPGLIIRGLPVTVNSFIINVTDSTSRNTLGEIHGSPTLTNNIFHIHSLAMPLKLLDGQGILGSINQLQIFDDLLFNSVIIVDMNVENGYIKYTSSYKSKRETVSDLVSDMKNINTFVGRQYGFERVYPHCTTTSVNHADQIIIRSNVYCDRNYNLVMGIGRKTSVTFTTQTETNTLGDSYSVEGVFHYKFTSPRSFDIQGGGQVEGTHIYYLPVVIDDLKSLSFSNDTQTFSYSVHPVKKARETQLVYCSHKMISDLNPEDQFYTQPRFVTKEGFHIQISRTGSIILTIGTEPSADYSHSSETDIRYRIVPVFLPVAQKLQITILSKLSSEVFLYVGHSSSSKDRNVIQNSVNQTSHLVSGGATNTIFHIVDLKHDVFIYPGFAPETCNHSEEVPISLKQVIDLSSIVATLRARAFAEKKYVPTITRKDSDLILRIQGYEAIYPGKIIIVDGVTCANRFKTLFNAHTVDFKKTGGPLDGSNSSDLGWSFFPHPVIVPKGHRIITYPADLEDNFTITYENAYKSKGSRGHPSETIIQDSANTSFKAYRNGSDLIISNVDSVLSGQEEHGPVEPVTSTTFTGFFEANGGSEETKPPANDPLSDSASAYVTTTAETEKSKIIYVWGTSCGTITLPGLNLVLSNGTAVEASDSDFSSKDSTDLEVDRNNTAPIVRPWLALFETVTNKHIELPERVTTLVPTVTERKNQSVLVFPVPTEWPDFEFWAILTAAITALISLTLSFLWIIFRWRAAMDIYSPQRCYKRECILGNSSANKLLPNTAISL